MAKGFLNVASGGSSKPSTMNAAFYTNKVTLLVEANSFEIGIPQFDVTKDKILIYEGGIYQSIPNEITVTSTTATLVSGVWEAGTEFDILVIKQTPTINIAVGKVDGGKPDSVYSDMETSIQAKDTGYDNTLSELVAKNVQAAIDELLIKVNSIADFVDYSIPYFLYNLGDECTNITGGWVDKIIRGTAIVTKNIDNLYLLSEGTSSDGIFVTQNTIDLTEYTKLKIEYKANTTSGWADICIGTSNLTNALWDSNTAGMHLIDTDVRIVSEVDITAIVGSYYIKIGTGSGGIAGMYLNAYKIWLEK